jgi:Zn-dependent protease with chaperone function
MDFFARQDHARRNTTWLIVYFALAVLSTVLILYAAAMGAYNASQHHSHGSSYAGYSSAAVLWNWKIFLAVTTGTLAVIFLGSAWKTSQLSGGGGSVAMMMGGIPINPATTDLDERKLLNVVEEMAIAAGVPVPEVYVLKHEEGINAFAAGHSPSDAAIGVTAGCLRLLTREELQGVIGHEFSHVLNGDMRLNIRLLGTIFGIICLASIGRILLQMRSSSSRDRNPLPLIGVVLLIVGSIGVFFGRLIQSAVCRQREFLADASAVQFTRNPSGLSRALQKIGRHSYGSKIESANAPDLAHFFFGNGLGDPSMELMATHPPIEDRIRAIDPLWDGKFPPLQPQQIETVMRGAYASMRPSPLPDIFQNLGGALTGAAILDQPLPPTMRPQNVAASVGTVTPLHMEYAEKLRNELPENLKLAARDTTGASALIYSLLLANEETLRARQLAEIARRNSIGVSQKTADLFTEVSTVAKRARLPLVNLAIGTLRNLSAEEFGKFSDTLGWLVGSDGKVEMFEFVLQKIVRRHLATKFASSRPPGTQYYSFKPLAPDCAAILSALARAGSDDPSTIQKAFTAGAPFLRSPVEAELGLMTPEQCRPEALDAALDRLALAAPIIKKNLLEAGARVVAADGTIHESEAELLRAVADTLDCPLPPMLA